MTTATSDSYRSWTKAAEPPRNRIIGASFGEVGTLKTTFWLGAPGPIGVFSIDQGLEGVVEEVQETKDIYVKTYDWSVAPGALPDQQEAIDLRDRFTEDFEAAMDMVKRGLLRTVFVDKETDIFGVFKYAEFGPPEKGRPDDWDMLKNRLRRLYNMPKSLDCNFGLIQGMKNEWVPETNAKTGKKGIAQTGARVRTGMDDVGAIVHINIEHVVENGEFYMNVGKARGPGGRDIQNKTIPFVEFATFGQMVFPDSTPEDWA